MLAICGLIAPEFVRVPGEIFQDVSVLDAHNVMVRASQAELALDIVAVLRVIACGSLVSTSLGKAAVAGDEC